MNNTKWDELRHAMLALGDRSPKWRTKCVANNYISSWDGEWFYHFSEGGYEDIEWVEIKVESEQQRELVLLELQKIHVPGQESKNGFKVYGYVEAGKFIGYL